jgi:hypothetical protein
VGPRANMDAVAKKKGPCPYRESNPGRSACSLVTILSYLGSSPLRGPAITETETEGQPTLPEPQGTTPGKRRYGSTLQPLLPVMTQHGGIESYIKVDSQSAYQEIRNLRFTTMFTECPPANWILS